MGILDTLLASQTSYHHTLPSTKHSLSELYPLNISEIIAFILISEPRKTATAPQITIYPQRATGAVIRQHPNTIRRLRLLVSDSVRSYYLLLHYLALVTQYTTPTWQTTITMSHVTGYPSLLTCLILPQSSKCRRLRFVTINAFLITASVHLIIARLLTSFKLLFGSNQNSGRLEM